MRHQGRHLSNEKRRFEGVLPLDLPSSSVQVLAQQQRQPRTLGLGVTQVKASLSCFVALLTSSTTKLTDLQDKTLLSFSFYQATVPELSNTNAMLCRLIYMLVDTQLSFISHIQKSFKDTGEPRFGDAETWTALCNMFLDILRDLRLVNFYM